MYLIVRQNIAFMHIWLTATYRRPALCKHPVAHYASDFLRLPASTEAGAASLLDKDVQFHAMQFLCSLYQFISVYISFS